MISTTPAAREAAHEQALAIESLAESTVPNLVSAMEWALERIGTDRERPWMWTMAREMEWALNARGFETVPSEAHAAALEVEQSKAYLTGLNAADRAFNAPDGPRWR